MGQIKSSLMTHKTLKNLDLIFWVTDDIEEMLNINRVRFHRFRRSEEATKEDS